MKLARPPLLVAAILAIAVVVGGLAYVVRRSTQPGTPAESPITSPSPTIPSTPLVPETQTEQPQPSLEFSVFDNGKVRFKYPKGWKVTEQKPRHFGSYQSYLGISIAPPGVIPMRLDPLVIEGKPSSYTQPNWLESGSTASGFYIVITELGYLSLVTHEEAIKVLEQQAEALLKEGIWSRDAVIERVERVRVSGRLAVKSLQKERWGEQTWRLQNVVFPAYRGQSEGLQVFVLDRAPDNVFSEALADTVMLSLELNEGFWGLSGSGPGNVEGAPV